MLNFFSYISRCYYSLRFSFLVVIMDAFLSNSVPPLKRQCPFAAATPPAQPMYDLLLALFSLPNPAASLAAFLEWLIESRDSDASKERAIEDALRVGSVLVEVAMRSSRKRASTHNSDVWPLHSDLTVKVFSVLDTRSLCHAAATCSMFNKCSIDPMCYANIDLTTATPKVNNTIVTTMVERAGKNLQSLKLGVRPSSAVVPSHPISRRTIDAPCPLWNEKKTRQGRESATLTRSCLLSLAADGGAAGALLRRLHLYNVDKIDGTSLCSALSACPSLVDLEVIGLYVELKPTVESVSKSCSLIERLCIEASETGRDDSLYSPTCVGLIKGCPNIKSFILRGFKLHDYTIKTLLKGFHHLRFVDFSTSYSITGSFLRYLSNGTNAPPLEVLILRDCLHLREVEVASFISALLAGDCMRLRYLDVSNKDGLSSENDWNERCYMASTLTERLREERPHLFLLAEFPHEGRSISNDYIDDSEVCRSNDGQSSSWFSSSSSSSESTYNYDVGSGNDDVLDISYTSQEGENFDDEDLSNDSGGL